MNANTQIEPLQRVVRMLQESDKPLPAQIGVIVDRDTILTITPWGEPGPESFVAVAPYLQGSPQLSVRQDKIVVSGNATLKLLRIVEGDFIDVPPIEFATTRRLDNKTYHICGVPTPDGGLTEVIGRIEREREDGRLILRPSSGSNIPFDGISGAPVWCPELDAFVGIVEDSQPELNSVICLPSRELCRMHADLPVRYRIPTKDRPVISTYDEDPNADIFGKEPQPPGRELSCEVTPDGGQTFNILVRYEADRSVAPVRGRFVTFLTYPDIVNEGGSAYELFAEVGIDGTAVREFYASIPDFTVAAIADGGDTVLTKLLEPPAGGPPKKQRRGDSQPESKPRPYRSMYASFETDLVAFDRRGVREALPDSLGVEDYARNLAFLITARKTPLPLSLGLFGEWGGGKSYFMRLLHQQIEERARANDEVFCRKVVQIHFNAWHYLDTNLWANLVCEIFDNLFDALTERADTPNEKIEQLKTKLANESALAAEAKKALGIAQQARDDAEKTLETAKQAREQKERSVAAFIDDLGKVVRNDDLKAQLKDLADGFGLSHLHQSYEQLEARVIEARSVSGRFKTLALALLSPSGRGQRLALLGAVLLATVAVPFFVSVLLSLRDAQLAAFTSSITATTTFIGSLAAWLASQSKRGSELIASLESAYEKVKKVRENDQQVAAQRIALEQVVKKEADARHLVHEAEARVRAIELELRELAPGRRLLHFLEERSATKDYRQHLGLVSLVRRDFEQLSSLLREADDFKHEGQPMLDRIVLYIDDLDRCKSDRVIAVLEAVHLLLAFPIFAVVVAVDPRWLRQSLREHYPVHLARETADHADAVASPQDYLEKIFQVPFQLQRMEERGFRALISHLLPTEAPAASPAAPLLVPTAVSMTAPTPASASAPAVPARTAAPSASASAALPKASTHAVSASIPSQQLPVAQAIERLRLEEWEQAAVHQCHPLFRTPRAVKRLANTYCLLRAGVKAAEWLAFVGSPGDSAGGYRVPLLMLAVAAAYPRVATVWLEASTRQKSWAAAAAACARSASAGRDKAEWAELMCNLGAMKADEFAKFDRGDIAAWLPVVRRFCF